MNNSIKSVDENTGNFIEAINTRNIHIMKVCDVFKEMLQYSTIKVLTEPTKNVD